jgi:hypothetical protein
MKREFVIILAFVAFGVYALKSEEAPDPKKLVGQKLESLIFKGQELKNVEITAVEVDGVKIVHSTGMGRIRYEDLPEEWKKQFDEKVVKSHRDSVEEKKRQEEKMAAANTQELDPDAALTELNVRYKAQTGVLFEKQRQARLKRHSLNLELQKAQREYLQATADQQAGPKRSLNPMGEKDRLADAVESAKKRKEQLRQEIFNVMQEEKNIEFQLSQFWEEYHRKAAELKLARANQAATVPAENLRVENLREENPRYLRNQQDMLENTK